MPHPIRIINHTQGSLPAVKAQYCDDFFSRLRGFTFKKVTPTGDGLVLVEKHDSRVDTSIHMFFVFSDLAVFWVNSSLDVVDKTLAKSWRPFYASKAPSRYVIELHPSRLEDFQIGDAVEFRND